MSTFFFKRPRIRKLIHSKSIEVVVREIFAHAKIYPLIVFESMVSAPQFAVEALTGPLVGPLKSV